MSGRMRRAQPPRSGLEGIQRCRILGERSGFSFDVDMQSLVGRTRDRTGNICATQRQNSQNQKQKPCQQSALLSAPRFQSVACCGARPHQNLRRIVNKLLLSLENREKIHTQVYGKLDQESQFCVIDLLQEITGYSTHAVRQNP